MALSSVDIGGACIIGGQPLIELEPHEEDLKTSPHDRKTLTCCLLTPLGRLTLSLHKNP